MKVLFIHQNFPAQFRHLARVLGASADNEVVYVTKRKELEIPGVRKVVYDLSRDASASTHHYIAGLEKAVLYGQAVARVTMALKRRGFVPDVVYAHPGWGEPLYVKDVYPDSPLVNLYEFYYRTFGSDVDFDPSRPPKFDDVARIRTKNTTNLLSLESCDWGVCPTKWQYAQFPQEYRYKLSVVHDGIDTKLALPNPNTRLKLSSGVELGRDSEVVTYVARNLEPYRGFPSFMRAVTEICRRRPNCHILIVGADGVSYGAKLAKGDSWRKRMLAEAPIDPRRVHFLGTLSYANYIQVLQISSVHVYLTIPFVLSWSMLEAMAAECLVVGSDTAPVREVIEDGKNGLLVDFFSPNAIADRVDEVLDHPDRTVKLRKQARKTIVSRYELSKCMPRQLAILERLAAGRGPKPQAARATKSKKTTSKKSAAGAPRRKSKSRKSR